MIWMYITSCVKESLPSLGDLGAGSWRFMLMRDREGEAYGGAAAILISNQKIERSYQEHRTSWSYTQPETREGSETRH